MPTVIDHAINIPSRQANVWNMIRDISQNPNWQLDCQRVQFLSTSKTGRGTRWRNTTARGKEQVIEILAWYEGLGYEYRIVDGANFNNSRGRIRLQEAPEGTIVQWTFSYEVKGFMGNLQNNLGAKRSIDNEIVQGLRKLWSLIKEAKAEEQLVPEESKSYLKEAPNVEERAKYQPRHPSSLKAQEIGAIPDADAAYKPPARSTGTTPQVIETVPRSTGTVPVIPEPPVSDDDTAPNRVVQPEAPKPAAEAKPPVRTLLNEPDFLRDMPEQLPQNPVPIPQAPIAPKQEEETAAAPPQLPVETEVAKPMPAAKVEPLNPEREYSKMDTAQVSVFELFGLPKPSETERVRAINDEPAPAATVFEQKLEAAEAAVAPVPVSAPEPEVLPLPPVSTGEMQAVSAIFTDKTPIIADVEPEPKRRTGLRASLRQRLAPVRLPKSDS